MCDRENKEISSQEDNKQEKTYPSYQQLSNDIKDFELEVITEGYNPLNGLINADRENKKDKEKRGK